MKIEQIQIKSSRQLAEEAITRAKERGRRYTDSPRCNFKDLTLKEKDNLFCKGMRIIYGGQL